MLKDKMLYSYQNAKYPQGFVCQVQIQGNGSQCAKPPGEKFAQVIGVGWGEEGWGGGEGGWGVTII